MSVQFDQSDAFLTFCRPDYLLLMIIFLSLNLFWIHLYHFEPKTSFFRHNLNFVSTKFAFFTFKAFILSRINRKIPLKKYVTKSSYATHDATYYMTISLFFLFGLMNYLWSIISRNKNNTKMSVFVHQKYGKYLEHFI